MHTTCIRFHGQHQNKQSQEVLSTERPLTLVLPQISGITDQVCKAWRSSLQNEQQCDNARFVRKPLPNVRQLLSNFSNKSYSIQDQIKNASSVIYGAICTQCPKDTNRPHYIGQTSQRLGKRFEGHFYDKTNHSAIYDHMQETGHKRPAVFILHVESDVNKRKIVESYYIRGLNPVLNRDKGTGLYFGGEFQSLVAFNYN